MFDDEVREQIFAKSELQKIDLMTLSLVIKAIEEVLEENNMSKREEYAQVERERICELLQDIDKLEVLSCIYTFTSSVAQHQKGGAK